MQKIGNVKSEFTILVNSCDGFEDCWEPFFKLFCIYWPECKNLVLLNTENKSWKYPNLNIKCTQIAKNSNNKKLTWSECLLGALRQVDTPLVLYLQEDYFFEKKVDVAKIDYLASLMLDNPEIKHVGLTSFGSIGPFLDSNIKGLWKIRQKAKYRISTQAGLWRTESLKSYLRPNENGWMFEILGTRRAQRKNEDFYTAVRSVEDKPIIFYTHTGIIKGSWHPKMPSLFKSHDINVDTTLRGLYKEKNWILRKYETFKKLATSPRTVLIGLVFPDYEQ